MNEPPAQDRTPTGPQPRSVGSSLRTRMRLYAIAGFVVVGGWLYFTVQTVFSLYDSTVQIARFTELRERVADATAGLQEASDSLDRYTRDGEGFDLSQHYSGRTTLKTSIGAIQNHPADGGNEGRPPPRGRRVRPCTSRRRTTRSRTRKGRQPGESLAVRDNRAAPAAAQLREAIDELERIFARNQAISEQQLQSRRDAATTALVVLAAPDRRRARVAARRRQPPDPLAVQLGGARARGPGGGPRRAAPVRRVARRDRRPRPQLQRGVARLQRAGAGARVPGHRVLRQRRARRGGDDQRPGGLPHAAARQGPRGHRRVERGALPPRRRGRLPARRRRSAARRARASPAREETPPRGAETARRSTSRSTRRRRPWTSSTAASSRGRASISR